MLWYLYYDGGPDDKETNKPISKENIGGELMRCIETTDASEAIRKISTELFLHLAKPKDSSFVVCLFRIPEKSLSFEVFFKTGQEQSWNELFNVSRDAFQCCADQITYWNMFTGEDHFDITEEPTKEQQVAKIADLQLYRLIETKDPETITKAKEDMIDRFQRWIDLLRDDSDGWALYQEQIGTANDTEVNISQVRSQKLVKEKLYKK